MPVSVLRFVAPTDVPGNDATSSCKTSGKAHEKRLEITYQPWMRHFKIALFKPSTTAPDTVWYIHETRVSSWT